MIFEKQIKKMYRSQVFGRCDDTGNVFYFSADDFDGLKKEPFAFTSAQGNKLQGYFYSYENSNPDRLIVFDHGYGGGHRAYMKEIEMLCRHGFKVFSYDHTGCMESQGESTRGLLQSLSDLNDCISALKETERCGSRDISVMGHSWGGFSTLNIASFHKEISHIIVLSGFISIEKMIEQNFSGILKGYRKCILEIEKETNPRYFSYNAIDTLSNTDAKTLLIYSSNDKRVSKKIHFDAMKEALEDKKNIRFLLVDGREHNPNYTADAIGYMNGFFSQLTKNLNAKKLRTPQEKEAFVKSFDWHRMTAQDENIWKEIFETLDS